MSDDPTRAPYSSLRAWVPPGDEAARERARALLEAHIAGAEPAPQRRRPRRRWRGRWVASLAGIAVVAGAGAGVAAILDHTVHTDRLPVFTPQGALAPQFTVGSRGSGYCWTTSLASATTDAYRCMQGNAIHDPCFAASPRARTVACFIDPWHRVTLLTLQRPLPGRPATSGGAPLPWAIVTQDGRRCTYLTGATAPMGGERINYGCIGGSFLLGAPNTRNPLWTIRSARGYEPDVPGRPTPISRFPLVGIRDAIS